MKKNNAYIFLCCNFYGEFLVLDLQNFHFQFINISPDTSPFRTITSTCYLSNLFLLVCL
jgi:hypothetical protein